MSSEKLRVLRRNRTKRGIHHPLLAVDCENNPDTGAFICAGVFGDVRKKVNIRQGTRVITSYFTDRIDLYFDDLVTFNDYLLSLPKNSCMLVFFNLSYDKAYINNILKHNTVLSVGTRVILAKLQNGIKCIDLANHTCFGSLEDWIGYLDMLGKYGIKKEELTDLRVRVMSDAKATFYLGSFLEDFYYFECGVPLMVTVGANALRLFLQKYFTDYWERNSNFYAQYERKAYYGGRVEIFKRGKLNSYCYDINSTYLSIMNDCLIPDVATSKFVENGKNWREYFDKYLGIFHCRVRTPDKYIMLLPVRIDGKLKFPIGEFTGYWTTIELQEALTYGYEIIDVYDFVYYRHSKYYFREYAKFIWAKRVEYKKKNNLGMDMMIKRMGNALYGKFAQRNSQEYFGRLSDLKVIPDVCEFFDFHGELWVLVSGEPVPAKHEFPAVSAFITSYARVKLFRAMIANEGALIYCDTDSIKLTSKAVKIVTGKGLGQWCFEGKNTYEFYRPKFYGDTIKGVPKRAVLVEATTNHKTYKFSKPLREREAIKKGLTPNVWVEVIKVLTFTDDKRDWQDNCSKPVYWDDSEFHWKHTEAEYQDWLKKRYEPKLVYGARDYDIDYPEYQGDAEQEKLDDRRSGNMIYQRNHNF